MVGKYGETLVVDWGLAKALGQSGETVEDPEDPLPESSLQPASADGLEATQAGSRVGTPAYMSPEQAAGRLDLLGPASDVYGLGATLYHLLVGRPPVEATTLGELYAKIQAGEITRPRTLAPWLDPALEAICLKAMALRPEARYATPKALAEDLDRWIAGEPVTAYPEPWTRRARRWARKHRTAVTATASTTLVAALLIGAFTWVILDRTRRADDAGLDTLVKVEFLEADARKTSDPVRYSEAIAEARRAEAQLESGGGSNAAKARVKGKLAELQEALRIIERDLKLVAELDEARLLGANEKDGGFDSQAKADAILAAFQSYGIDLASLSNEEVASRVRSSRMSADLMAALYEAGPLVTKLQSERLATVVRLVDTNTQGADIRDRLARKDFEGLRRLVAEEAGRRELGARCRTIFSILADLDPTASIVALEAIHRANRGDFWLTHELAMACQTAQPPRLESAIRYYYSAVALKPTSPGVFINLGNALVSKGEVDAAIAAFREAIRIKPDLAVAHSNLGAALRSRGEVDAAIAASREAIRIKPDYAEAHVNLGLALDSKGEVDTAIAAFREASRLKPDFALAHYNLGTALDSKGEVDAAIAAFREAIRIKPDYAEAHHNLGIALRSRGEFDAAIAAYREAIRLKPDFAEAHYNLGNALDSRGEFDAAIAASREAIRLKPDFAQAYYNLGNAHNSKGEFDAAIAAYREATRLRPDYAKAHHNLGTALGSKGEFDAANAAFREAIRLKPDDALAHCNLGFCLRDRGEFVEALKIMERGHELGSKQVGWRNPSAEWVQSFRRLVDLDAKLVVLLKGETPPIEPGERVELADLCSKKGLHAASARFYGQAFADQPRLAEDLETGHRYNAACAAALGGSGMGKDEPPLDEAGRTKLREQALGWLRADLAAWAKILDGGKEPARKQEVARTLAHWKEDADLSGIRDEGTLAKLPEGEREGFRALWAEVDRLLAKARAGAP
jgi:eukaryotic-like serine/threonine-protein kinase